MWLLVILTFRYVQDTTGFPVYPNGTAQYYLLGDELFPAMLTELEKAEKFIFAEYFIVERGAMWDAMVEIMARKAAQGVVVRVLYDDLGRISTYAGDDVKALWKKGIQRVPFNPLIFVRDPQLPGPPQNADHRRQSGLQRRFGRWKDTGFRLTGPAVQNYTRMFVEFWNAFAAEPLPDELLVPPSAPPEGSAFVRAARRGVDVRIIMPGIPDKKLVFRMSHSFYPVLLDAGVKIYEYVPGFIHAKGCVIDGTVGAVGTVNLDYRSLFLHFENNSLFYGAPILNDVEADFLDTQAKCREMKLGENVKVNFRHWLLDGVLRIFAPLC